MTLTDARTAGWLKPLVEQDGFAVVPACLDQATLEHLSRHFDDTRHPQRNLLSVPSVHGLAVSKPVREIIETVLGPKCFAVRGIFFNKTRSSNWKVVWHQDLTIAVRERKEVLDLVRGRRKLESCTFNLPQKSWLVFSLSGCTLTRVDLITAHYA